MKRYIIILSLAILAVTAFGQHDEQVTVEGKYRPKVNKVNKLLLTPETPQPSYNFPSSEVNPKEAKQKFALDLEKLPQRLSLPRMTNLLLRPRTSSWLAWERGSRRCSSISTTPC